MQLETNKSYHFCRILKYNFPKFNKSLENICLVGKLYKNLSIPECKMCYPYYRKIPIVKKGNMYLLGWRK